MIRGRALPCALEGRRGPPGVDEPHARRPSGGDSSSAAGKWLWAFWIAIPAAYALLLLVGWDRVGAKDHDQLLSFHSLQYWNSKLFGLDKQWAPVLCGGFSLAGDPQVPVLSLGMLGGYVFGPLLGIRLATLVYLVVGWVGGYLYAGLLTPRRQIRALAGSLFIGNGFFVCRLSHGHLTFLPFLTLPLVLWMLHRTARPSAVEGPRRRASRLVFSVLGLAVIFALAIDGSPVAILHLLTWCGVYALVLSVVKRRLAPVLVFGSAVFGAAFLDAAYLLPMLVAQESFPRLRADTFTNPVLLLWFMVLPIRGRLLPAPTNGHELSVFVGPIVVWLVVKHRRWLRDLLPNELALPLFVTSAVGLWLGMGSLTAIGVPEILSPFDWIRDLPGFRSMGVTGRFWGFLALPLSLLGAAALSRAAAEEPARRFRCLAVLLFLFQLGFQLEGVVEHLWFSPRYVPVDTEAFYERPETLEFVSSGERGQALVVSPVRCVVDCYNDHDFELPPMETGDALVVGPIGAGRSIEAEPGMTGVFVDWSTIRLQSDPDTIPASGVSRTVRLNQAFHPLWTAGSGRVTSGPEGRLVVESVPTSALSHGVELRFHDPASARGVAISRISWYMWTIMSLILVARNLPSFVRDRRAGRWEVARALGAPRRGKGTT